MPLLMLVLAGGLASLLLYVDGRVDPGMKASLPWAYTGGPAGARSLLSTIAGSMITAASVTFSLAAVALSIASQQYGSRVLRNFMRDRITQVLLGTFVSTFIYSVMVIRTIRGSDYSGGFVPAISVTVAIVLSLISLVLLIFFIHHVSASIQASRIIRVIAEDMSSAIPKLYSPRPNSITRETDQTRLSQLGTMPITTVDSGYLQTINQHALLDIAMRKDLLIHIEVKTGDHLIAGKQVARILGTSSLSAPELHRVVGSFLLGGERTPAQDIRYQFQQLTDVVIRALSPGINDPFTAVNGIDELEAATALLAKRGQASQIRTDKHGVARLYQPVATISDILEDTVGHIAIYGAGDRFVMAALRRVLDTVEPELHRDQDLATLVRLREQMASQEQAKAV